MSVDNPLTYSRATLIEVLQERLTEKQNARAEAKTKLEEKNKAAVDQLNELIAEYPQFLVWLASTFDNRWGAIPGTDRFAAKVKDSYGNARIDGTTRDPDEDLLRLIRVYEKAQDDTVKVYVTDEVFNYL